MTDWDRQCIADMQRTIAKIEAALAAGPDARGMFRPLIGDCRPSSREYWERQIADNRRWIAEIEEA